MFFYIIRRRARRLRRTRTKRRKSANQADYKARKAQARQFVAARLEYFRQIYAMHDPLLGEALTYNKLAIRNQRSRWGSCSSKKNLNFNYRILDLPPELQDYVIVHELCHLKELHHRKAFWDLMKITIPNALALHNQTRKMKLS